VLGVAAAAAVLCCVSRPTWASCVVICSSCHRSCTAWKARATKHTGQHQPRPIFDMGIIAIATGVILTDLLRATSSTMVPGVIPGVRYTMGLLA
jgi:hypothetical protein